MQVQSINNRGKYNYQQNKPSFKGLIKSEAINDLMTKTPVMIQERFNLKEISPNKTALLWQRFMKAFESIHDCVANLNFFTTLETISDGFVQEVVLKNAYSEYVESLNYKFTERTKVTGYKAANFSLEENVDILTDLANCLEKVDVHGVEAKMVLHSDNPSCIRDAIRKTYKNEVK